MAFAASMTSYRWVPVNANGPRVRIYAGPLIHAAPVQWVQFARSAPGLPDASITFSITMWSAAAPWSFYTTGFATAWRDIGAIVGTVDIFKPPWDAGIPIWALASPWAEFFVTANLSCKANLFVP